MTSLSGVRAAALLGPALLVLAACSASTPTQPTGHDLLTEVLAGLVGTPCQATGHDGYASSVDLTNVGTRAGTPPSVQSGRWRGHITHGTTSNEYGESIIDNGSALYIQPDPQSPQNSDGKWIALASTADPKIWSQAFSTYSQMPGTGGQYVTNLAMTAAGDETYTCAALVTALTNGTATTTNNGTTITVTHANLGAPDTVQGTSTTVTITAGSTPRVTAITNPPNNVALTLTYPASAPTFAPPNATDTRTAQQAAAPPTDTTHR